MSFTLFIILPNKDVSSLRHLASGTSIRAVRKILELSAGLPAQTYRLTCREGQVLHEDHVLRMDVNVWDGYVIRAVFLDSWQELYDPIVANDVDRVIRHGAVHMRDEVVWVDAAEEERAREVMRERGVVALFVASFLGMLEMCRALLSVGVNPNGRSLFGRTPMFAAMSRDHDHVMELLLSHNASLESRDSDGVTAVDIARRAAAKQCMRKVRHLYLQSKGESATTTTSTSVSSDTVRRKGPRVIRIPTGTVVQKEAPHTSTSDGKARTTHDDHPHASTVPSSLSSNELHTRSSEHGDRKASLQAPSHRPKPSRVPQPRALYRQDRKNADVYMWDDNLSHLSRAPSAAGTQARLSLGSRSEGHMSRGGHRTRGAGGAPHHHGGDRRSAGSSSASHRMLPFRPSVQELSIKGPGSVLTTSTAASVSTTLSEVTLSSLVREEKSVKPRRPSALLRFLARAPHSHPPSSSSSISSTTNPASQRPHVPAREPPGRPPTRVDSGLASSDLQEPQDGGSVGAGSALGSQEALSVGSAPELSAAMRELGKAGGGRAEDDHGESDDDGGRVVTSHASGPRFSGRFRTHLLASRQKQQESWRTMKRRIKLAEDQKRHTTLQLQPTPQRQVTARRESFEDWLERKRRQPHGTGDEDTSEDDEDMMDRPTARSHIFDGWLRDLKQEPPPSSPPQTSSGRQKSRSAKHRGAGSQGSQAGAEWGTDRQMEADSYPTTYRQWQHRKKQATTGPRDTVQDMEEAKIQLEEKRKSLLAMALTLQDWTEHTEQRKKLMQAILRADMDKLAAIEQHFFPDFSGQGTPRQISFNEWREKVDKKEAEIRQQRQRIRKEAEFRQRNGVVGDEFMRNNAGDVHEEWLRQKTQAAVRDGNKEKHAGEVNTIDGSSVALSEDEKENAVGEWLGQKRKQEVARLNQHLRHERQLLLSVRQKKPTVTQC